ncbi:aspartic peptidase domain-containing protein [Copromyces sp. CBS 386.78]|nr:aspartic peptidase domain-containing protein [Copromyces sp. CBS 386.78]
MAPYALFRHLWPAALCLVEVASAADGYVHLPFSRPQLMDLDLGQNGSRTLSDFVVPYLVKAQVGTPPQDFSLLISPTSTDTWLVDATTEYCDYQYYQRYWNDDDVESDDVHKCVWGSFNRSESSTFRNANSRHADFEAFTFSGYARGTNFTDKLVIGDLTFDNYPMGLVDNANSWMGVLGLGYNYSNTLSYYSYSGDSTPGTYPTILDRMVSSGQISTPAYSIWLDNGGGSSGSLLFGAIDKSRYEGDLIRLSATNPHAVAGKFSVSVHSINTTRLGAPDGGMQSSLISNDLPFDVTIGMGELISFLPSDLVSNIASVVGATHDTTAGLYTIPCADDGNAAVIAFRLGGEGGPLLQVYSTDLILNPGVFNGQVSVNDVAYYSTNSMLDLPDGACVFSIQTWDDTASALGGAGVGSSASSSSSSYYNLGNSLLRRSYFVFDLARQELAVAPAVFSSASSSSSGSKATTLDQANIVAFTEYGAIIPESEYFCSDYEYYCPTDSINYGSAGGGGSTHGGSGSSSDVDYYYYGMRNWKPISIGLGIVFGTLVLVGLLVAGVLWKRVLQKDRQTMGLNRDEEQRLMDGGEGGGGGAAQPMMSPAAGTAAGSATGGAAAGGGASSGGPGLLPIIREGREDDADSYLPAREGEASAGPAQAQASQMSPVDSHANREQRLSAPSNLMDAPRSPSPLSEDGIAGARAEAASPVSERLGTPPSEVQGKGKGKAVAENIGQAQ